MNRRSGNIVDFPLRETNLENGGGGSHDGGMEHRLTALETRLDTVLPTLATRGDVHKIDASIKGWMIATIISLFLGFAGLFFTVSSSMRQQPQASAPVVIQVPYAVQQPASQQQPSTPPIKQ